MAILNEMERGQHLWSAPVCATPTHEKYKMALWQEADKVSRRASASPSLALFCNILSAQQVGETAVAGREGRRQEQVARADP
jgi:hypothetical protein